MVGFPGPFISEDEERMQRLRKEGLLLWDQVRGLVSGPAAATGRRVMQTPLGRFRVSLAKYTR